MRICARCVLDESIPEIEFNQEGICNYCEVHDNLVKAFPNDRKGKEILEKTFEDIKVQGKGKRYDCIVGVSGGTDSSYLIHLAKSYGLNPLAVYIDNGWNSKVSIENINKMVKALQIDIKTYVVDPDEINSIFKAFFNASYAWVDGVTDLLLSAVLYKMARKYGIKRILIGSDFRTEGRQPTEWTHIDTRTVKSINKKYGSIKKFSSFISLSLWDIFQYEFLYGIKMIKSLYYINYDKAKAKEFLAKEYNWEDYGGHHHESVFTRFIVGYWLPRKCGIDKRRITFSAQIRSGQRNREEALKELEELPYSEDLMQEDKKLVTSRLGFTKTEFDKLMKLPCTTYKDFPSYEKYFELVNKYFRFVYRIFGVKPMMAFELPKYHEKRRLPFDKYRLKKIASLVVSKAKVLDVGSADAPNIFLKNKEIIGLDINPIKETSNYTKVVKGDANKLESIFSKGSFDAITAGEIFEHLENPNLFLKGAHNILKPGGLLVLSTPNPNSIWERLLTLNLSRKYFYTPDHFNLYPQRSLIRILERNGFKNIKVLSGGLTIPFINTNIPFPRPWAEFTIIRAEK